MIGTLTVFSVLMLCNDCFGVLLECISQRNEPDSIRSTEQRKERNID